MITVNRPAYDLRNHIICGPEADRAEPEKKKIIRVPPANGGLENALDREDKQHQLSRGIQPGEPKERPQEIPLGNINLLASTESKHQNRPRHDQGIGDEKNDRRVRRELQPLV